MADRKLPALLKPPGEMPINKEPSEEIKKKLDNIALALSGSSKNEREALKKSIKEGIKEGIASEFNKVFKEIAKTKTLSKEDKLFIRSALSNAKKSANKSLDELDINLTPTPSNESNAIPEKVADEPVEVPKKPTFASEFAEGFKTPFRKIKEIFSPNRGETESEDSRKITTQRKDSDKDGYVDPVNSSFGASALVPEITKHTDILKDIRDSIASIDKSIKDYFNRRVLGEGGSEEKFKQGPSKNKDKGEGDGGKTPSLFDSVLDALPLDRMGKAGLAGAKALGRGALSIGKGALSAGGTIARFAGSGAGRLLGGAAAVGMGAYTAYSGYSSASNKQKEESDKIDALLKEGKITEEEAAKQKEAISKGAVKGKSSAVGEGVGQAAGGIVGMKAGAAAGAAIGSVVPVVGTAIGAGVGALVGGIGGAYLGGKGGEKLGSAVGSGINFVKDTSKQIGGAITGAGARVKGFFGDVKDTSKQIGGAITGAGARVKGFFGDVKDTFNRGSQGTAAAQNMDAEVAKRMEAAGVKEGTPEANAIRKQVRAEIIAKDPNAFMSSTLAVTSNKELSESTDSEGNYSSTFNMGVTSQKSILGSTALGSLFTKKGLRTGSFVGTGESSKEGKQTFSNLLGTREATGLFEEDKYTVADDQGNEVKLSKATYFKVQDLVKQGKTEEAAKLVEQVRSAQNELSTAKSGKAVGAGSVIGTAISEGIGSAKEGISKVGSSVGSSIKNFFGLGKTDISKSEEAKSVVGLGSQLQSLDMLKSKGDYADVDPETAAAHAKMREKYEKGVGELKAKGWNENALRGQDSGLTRMKKGIASFLGFGEEAAAKKELSTKLKAYQAEEDSLIPEQTASANVQPAPAKQTGLAIESVSKENADIERKESKRPAVSPTLVSTNNVSNNKQTFSAIRAQPRLPSPFERKQEQVVVY